MTFRDDHLQHIREDMKKNNIDPLQRLLWRVADLRNAIAHCLEDRENPLNLAIVSSRFCNVEDYFQIFKENEECK